MADGGFKPTEKQVEATKLMGGPAQHVMLVGGSRCVAGDTIIDGQKLTIKELAEIGRPIEVVTSRGKQKAEAPFLKGRCEMLRVELESGIKITVTPDHRFWDGGRWVKAETLTVGSKVAGRTCLQSLVPTIEESCQSKLPSNVQRLIQKYADFLDHCFSHFRRYGQRLRLLPTDDQVCRASQCGELAHSQMGLCLPFRAFEWHESSSHKARFSEPDAKYSRWMQPLFHPSKTDDFPSTSPAEQFASYASEQISEQSRDLQKRRQQSHWQFFLRESFEQLADAVQYQFSRFFGLSYDSPKKGGYSLCKVCSITQTAEKEYYTLHVPVTEQYFANGILHHNSAKTFQDVRITCLRALAAPMSRHAILRFRFNHVKASIVHDTFPKVMSLCFPGVDYKIDKTDWFAQLPEGAQVWFGGLDDKERTEKVLGQEYATLFLNECSQIPWGSRNLAVTRLAQNVQQKVTNQALRLKMFYDENPPSKSHWSYKLFVQGRDPDTNKPLTDPQNYAYMFMNPRDNMENLPPEYIKTLMGLPVRLRERFLEGRFSEIAAGALWNVEMIDRWRSEAMDLPDMQRIVIAVDPSGAGDKDNTNNDAIGIVVCGLGIDGNAYVLEDLTLKAGPKTWGNVVATAFDRHEADIVVAEKNYGGAMVKFVIQAARPGTRYRDVTSSRGKAVRAEPIAQLTEQGRVRFSGSFPELEDELCSFTTNGYIGENSPNRADALVFGITELFPGIVKERKKKREDRPVSFLSGNGAWLGA